MEKVKSFDDITEQHIQDWKAKTGHEELNEVSIKIKDAPEQEPGAPEPTEDLAKYARFICVPPTRSVMDALGQHSVTKNIAAANKCLISNCVLGGDMDILEREGRVYGLLLEKLNQLGAGKEVTIKNI